MFQQSWKLVASILSVLCLTLVPSQLYAQKGHGGGGPGGARGGGHGGFGGGQGGARGGGHAGFGGAQRGFGGGHSGMEGEHRDFRSGRGGFEREFRGFHGGNREFRHDGYDHDYYRRRRGFGLYVWPYLYGFGYGYPYGYYDYGYPYGYYGYGYPFDDYGYRSYYPPSYDYYPYEYGASVEPSMSAEEYSEQEFLARAQEAFRNGDYGEAERWARHAVVETPRDPDVHQWIALSLFALGDYRSASSAAHAALSLGEPWDWPTLRGFYGNVADYTAQLRALEKATRDDPSAAYARFLLAYHYLMLGHQDAARQQLAQVVKLDPGDQVAARLLGQLAPAETGPSAPAQQPEPAPAPATNPDTKHAGGDNQANAAN